MSTTAEQYAENIQDTCINTALDALRKCTLAEDEGAVMALLQSKELRAEIIELLTAYAHSRITSLAEEAEREAETHYNIAPPHRYHADLDQCKFKRAIAAWLRQKAEER
jgi:hypothetical protein